MAQNYCILKSKKVEKIATSACILPFTLEDAPIPMSKLSLNAIPQYLVLAVSPTKFLNLTS